MKALMEDDGTRWAPAVRVPRDKVTASDLLTLVQRKYDTLRSFVLEAMLEAAKSAFHYSTADLPLSLYTISFHQ